MSDKFKKIPLLQEAAIEGRKTGKPAWRIDNDVIWIYSDAHKFGGGFALSRFVEIALDAHRASELKDKIK